jgi:hypothetical protein
LFTEFTLPNLTLVRPAQPHQRRNQFTAAMTSAAKYGFMRQLPPQFGAGRAEMPPQFVNSGRLRRPLSPFPGISGP